MSKLVNYQDKVFLQELAEIPEINKVTDDNMNNIKTSVNNLYSVLGIYTDTYNSSTTYSINDLVIDNNTLYKSLTNNNTGNTPSSDGGTNWIDVSITNLFYPVGSYYETSDANFDPNVVWGGTWVLDSQGRVTVSQDTSDTDFDTLGETGGEKKHTLTQSELPNYNLKGLKWANSGVAITLDAGSYTPGYNLSYGYSGVNEGQIDSIIINSGGSNTPHNNLQPYVVVKRWHRIA